MTKSPSGRFSMKIIIHLLIYWQFVFACFRDVILHLSCPSRVLHIFYVGAKSHCSILREGRGSLGIAAAHEILGHVPYCR